jgi:hypothetical protein
MGLFPQKIAPAITLLAMYRHESVFLDARTSAQRARKYRDGKMWAPALLSISLKLRCCCEHGSTGIAEWFVSNANRAPHGDRKYHMRQPLPALKLRKHQE